MNKLINKKFSRLLVLSEEEKRNNIRYFKCRCVCGNIKITRGTSLINGKCKSCGCIQKEYSKKLGSSKKKHGMSRTIFYSRWKSMFKRCSENYKQFKDYKGRGISICDEWKDFNKFKEDMFNSFSEELSLDRIDNDGNYCKENCRWATRKEQNGNKRMYKLDKNKVEEIRKKYIYGNGRLLSKEYKVCPAVISEIVNKKRNYSKI